MLLNDTSCVKRCVKNSIVSIDVGGGDVTPEDGLGK